MRRTARRRVLRISPAEVEAPRADMLAVEEPLEIRTDGEPLTVTMRTPGDDIDLVSGFLFCEGIVAGASDLSSVRICSAPAGAPPGGAPGAPPGGPPQAATGWGANAAEVRLAGHARDAAAALRRSFLTTSACGVCGKDSIDSVRTRACYDVSADGVPVDPQALLRMPGTLRTAQRVFARTGGLHAAGLFTAAGELIVLREDVGRHNAVDKVVGWALRAGRLPLRDCVLVVSGRASFELVQKALMAGAPVLAAVSAPSSLAADLAEEAGMTLAGFVRGTSMNIYTGAQRIRSLDPARPSGAQADSQASAQATPQTGTQASAQATPQTGTQASSPAGALASGAQTHAGGATAGALPVTSA